MSGAVARPRPRPRAAATAALGVLLLVAAGQVGFGPQSSASASRATGTRSTPCPAGQRAERETATETEPSGTHGLPFTQGGTTAAAKVVHCESVLHAEGQELLTANASLGVRTTAPFTTLKNGAYASAVAQGAAITAASTSAESKTAWTPLGTGPEHADVAGYDEVNGLGLAGLSGRIQSFEHDPSNPKHWWAGVANGGVYETTNAGTSWHSIGDSLPTQIVGAIAWTKAGGGRLIVSTGDPSFGGDAITGLGAFWTADDGKTWNKAKGVPDGTISFRVAVDPATPSTVYAATGKGLYRSTDSGASYTNVVLPTTCTSTTAPGCFFANIVTDVVVRTPAKDGSGAHQVLAGVGWRAGQKLNAQGKPQAPQNGLYSSTTGAPGSFHYVTPSGFTPTNQTGRIALGAATGPLQDHAYVYALVQDSTKFNGESVTELDVPNSDVGAPTNTYLKGVYVSSDFGQTWHLMTGPTQLGTTSGTALAGANTATYAPGIQSWYNEWIDVDPTVANASGSPQRVALGLEEIFENTLPLDDTQATEVTNDTIPFKAIGAYFKGTSCGGLNTNLPVCPLTYNSPAASTTTHPDQHAAMFVPDAGEGGVTLVAGNDGGAYAQHVETGYGPTAPVVGGTSDFDNAKWGDGINDGLHTLLPYVAKMAKDGTVYGGLQDNGNLKITPSGQQIETFGGDGFFSAVDPDNSKDTYEEYTYGDIAVSTDGGMSWTDIAPSQAAAGNALFATPFKMDPLNSKHILEGTSQLVETTLGTATTSSDWTQVFDLGTSPTAAGATTPNVPSAVDVRGANEYVGYCGYCDIVTGGLPFHSGIATNVGGSVAPKTGTSNGWHIAAAKGLPQRYITSVAADPSDAKTVYVTMGGYGRRWIPPGSLADSVAKVGTGHLFVSHDAGATFTSIDGNLPDAPANISLLQKGRLIVGTDTGTYIAPTKAGKSFQRLGTGLPSAPVFDLEVSPRNSQEIVAASYGRGVYHIVLPKTAATGTTMTTTGGKTSTPGKGTGTLPTTGLPVGLGLGGVALLGVALVLRRRGQLTG